MPGRKPSFVVARQAARNHRAKHFAKPPRHCLTPPTRPHPATLILPQNCRWGRREEEGERLPSSSEAKLGHPCPSKWRTRTFLLALRLVVGWWCCARRKRGWKYPKRIMESSLTDQRGVMESWSWSSERNRVGITIPSTVAFPSRGSAHAAEVSSLETTVQRHLPGSFCRDVGEGLTLHLLTPVPTRSPSMNQGQTAHSVK